MLLSWSGGKDAAWALHRLRQSGIAVTALLTTVTHEYQRASMQGIRLEVIRAQAAAAGLPLLEAGIPANCDNPAYEAAFAAALVQARERWPGLETVAFGDLFLRDIRDYRVALCERLGWRAQLPLFGSDSAQIARQMLAAGLQAALCCVDTQQLAADFAGRDFDAGLLADLPASVDPCGEHGEFHTCVRAGPMFSRPLALMQGETTLREGRFAYTDYLLSPSSQAEAAAR